MLQPAAIVVLAVMFIAMVFFIWGKFRVDLVAVGVLVVLAILDWFVLNHAIFSRENVLFGFSSQATATVAAMFVISAALVRTGLVQGIYRHLDRIAGKTEKRLLLVLCVTSASLSAFLLNTATVAIFIPVAIVLARSRRISASRVLMPLSFASQIGGVCTLIGTSTNILVNSIAIDSGLGGFSLFEFAPLGLIMCVVGVVYLIFVTPWLLPNRKGQLQQVDQYRLADYLTELEVKENSPLIGNGWAATEAVKEKDIDLIKIIRDGKATWRATRTKIQQGDILLLHGHAEKLLRLQRKYKLRSLANVKVDDKEMSSDEVQLIEALVPPQSRLVGQSLDSFGFSRRFGCAVLAVQRRGKVLRDRLMKIFLEDGDTLLLQGHEDDTSRVLQSRDLIVTNEVTDLYLRKDRAVVALLMLAFTVVLAASNAIPIYLAGILGAMGMIVGRCLTLEEAYQAIDWKVIFLLGGMLPLGQALDQTGAASWLANTLLQPFSDFGPVAVLAMLYLITALLTENMSNTAAAAILAPLALSVAGAMEVDPRAFLVAITFAASTSFSTPVGYQTNTMIYAPGGYRFTDYTRLGGPLNLIFWILAVLFIPIFWPF